MSKFNDETINPIIVEIAMDNNISTDKVRDILEEYWRGVTHLIETGKPYQIKLDFFGKIKPKSKFEEIEEKILKKFVRLTPREDGVTTI